MKRNGNLGLLVLLCVVSMAQGCLEPTPDADAGSETDVGIDAAPSNDGDVAHDTGAASDADHLFDGDSDGIGVVPDSAEHHCGDENCSPDENPTSCPEDCPSSCGDDACTHEEDSASCPADCPSSCGDDACTHAEDAASCPDECPGECGDSTCSFVEAPSVCPEDCPAVCGDGIVSHEEECDTVLGPSCATPCGSAGRRACLSCEWAECVPPEELCNDLDDD